MYLYILVHILCLNIISVTCSRNIKSNNDQILYFLNKIAWNKITSTPNKCFEQITIFQRGVETGEEWAERMLDAWAKPQSGVLFGNTMHVGNYDECINVDNRKGIKGKYCSAIMSPHQKYGNAQIIKWFQKTQFNNTRAENYMTVVRESKKTYAFCVPRTCSITDLQQVADLIEDQLQFPVHFHFDRKYCGDQDTTYSVATILAMIIFGLVATAIVCSTLYDNFIYQKFKVKEPNLFVAFSLLSNGRKLFSAEPSEDTLHCLNGIKVLSMTWIIVSHSFSFPFMLPQVNTVQLLEWRKSIGTSFMLGGSMMVDTFLTIGGLLVTYLYFKQKEKGLEFGILRFYIHRIIRTTPSLAMVILFIVALIKYTGNGPFLFIIDELYVIPCQRNWWSTIIYLQNFFHPLIEEQCLVHAWYSSVDTQMYFLSPLILISLTKWPKLTINAIAVAIVLISAHVFQLTIDMDLGTTIFDVDANYYSDLYTPTYIRGCAYLIGMVCGYLVFKTRKKPFKLSQSTVQVLWLTSLAILSGIILIHSYFVNTKYTIWEASAFNSSSRVVWSITLSIIILLCLNDYGGIVNRILSSKIFVVMCRLNYSIYLIHFLVLFLVMLQARTPQYFSGLSLFHNFWGNYVFILTASIIWTLSFESPVIALENYFIVKRKQNIKTKQITK